MRKQNLKRFLLRVGSAKTLTVGGMVGNREACKKGSRTDIGGKEMEAWEGNSMSASKKSGSEV